VPGGSTFFLDPNEFRVTLASGASLSLTDTGFEVSLPTTIPTKFTLDSSGAVISTKNLGQTIHLDANSTVTLGLTGGLVRPSIPTVENVNVGPGGGITLPSPRVFAASA
jgi:serine acetyltransferase